MPYSILIAGSTKNTLLCAEVLANSQDFQISGILTPSPRLVGRKQELVQNPLHTWADANNISTFLIDKKIQSAEKLALPKSDFLLVVDFGYIVPDWLLTHPQIAPVNIHPSDLPKYRGSSPGQFTLLFGEKKSAVSVIVMNNKLDEGNIIHQEKFTVSSNWTSQDFYGVAFELIAEKLPKILLDFAQNQNSIPQPISSPTPIARRLSRDDGFVEWDLVKKIMNGEANKLQVESYKLQGKKNKEKVGETSQLLIEVKNVMGSWPQTLANASRALFPWPTLWTIVPTNKGKKRMKILQVTINNKIIKLEKVQIEGQCISSFNQIRNQLV